MDTAGLDFFTPRAVIIHPSETQIVGVGMKIALPKGIWGLLKERSSMGMRGVFVFGGVIDANYRGEVMVMLHNTSKEEWIVDVYHKICQLIIIAAQQEPSRETILLSPTDRGEKGFGSTDM